MNDTPTTTVNEAQANDLAAIDARLAEIAAQELVTGKEKAGLLWQRKQLCPVKRGPRKAVEPTPLFPNGAAPGDPATVTAAEPEPAARILPSEPTVYADSPPLNLPRHSRK